MSNSARILLLLGGLAAVAVGALSFAAARPGSHDDAFITLTYAAHLAESGSFYWNLEEGPVDGFTSLSDVLIKAAAIEWLPWEPWIATSWWTLALHVATALFLFEIARRRLRRGSETLAVVGAIAAAIAIAGSPALSEASAFRLETPLFVLLVAVGTALATSDRLDSTAGAAGWAAVLAIAALTRPEGIPFAFFLLVATTVTRPELRARLVAVWSLVGAVIAAYFGWRLLLFGTWAPNTYYAKTSDTRRHELEDGLRYVADAIADAPWTSVPMVLGFVGLLVLLVRRDEWGAERRRRDVAVITATATLLLAGVVWSGGDAYPGSRFLAPVMVLVVLGIVTAAAELRSRIASGALALLVAAAIAALALTPYRDGLAQIAQLRSAAEAFPCDRLATEHLARDVGVPLVGQSDFQRLKYFAPDLIVVDLHGLNHREIAHEPWTEPVRFGKYRPETAFAIAPPVWIYGHQFWSGSQPLAGFSTTTIMGDDRISETLTGRTVPPELVEPIARTYRPATARICDHNFNYLVRVDWAHRAEAAGARVGPTGLERVAEPPADLEAD